MERIVVDTSVLIAAERGREISELIAPDDDVAYAAITAAELWVGVHRAGLAQRAARRDLVEQRLAAITCLPYGLEVARAHGELLAHVTAAGQPRSAHDLIIAATARATGRTVVTLDRGGFDALPGVRVRS